MAGRVNGKLIRFVLLICRGRLGSGRFFGFFFPSHLRASKLELRTGTVQIERSLFRPEDQDLPRDEEEMLSKGGMSSGSERELVSPMPVRAHSPSPDPSG